MFFGIILGVLIVWIVYSLWPDKVPGHQYDLLDTGFFDGSLYYLKFRVRDSGSHYVLHIKSQDGSNLLIAASINYRVGLCTDKSLSRPKVQEIFDKFSKKYQEENPYPKRKVEEDPINESVVEISEKVTKE